MSTREERIIEIRGRERYEEGLRHIRVVSRGGREGALPHYRSQAARLMAFEMGLNDDRRLKIRTMLATGEARSTEDALLRMEQESDT